VTGIDVGVLGRPTVRVDGSGVDLSELQLALVVRLAIEGRPVSKDRLLHDIWPGDTGTDGALRVLLTRVRRLLPSGTIHRSSSGYTLVEASCDADEFERLARIASAPSTPAAERAAAAHEALALWTGPALDGLEAYPWATSVASQLERRRETLVIERYVALSERGRLGALLVELEADVARSPANERLAALLAIQLYRDGRQADGLAVIRRTRRVLRDDLGIRPGPELVAVEHQILNHDLTLDERRDDDGEYWARLHTAAALARIGAYDEAIELLEGIDEHAVGDELAAGILLARAQIAYMTGRPDADALVDRAKTIARASRNGPLLARSALVRFGRGVSADKVGALTDTLEATALLAPSAREHVDLLCVSAIVITFTDGSDAVVRLVDEAERLDARVGSRESRAAVLITKAIVGAVREGPTRDVISWAVEGYELAQQTEDPLMIVMAIQALLRVRYETGDIDAVDAVLDTLDHASRAALLPFGIVRVHLCRTMNALIRGELALAEDELATSSDVATRLDTHIAERATLVHRMLLLREREQLGDYLPIIQAIAAQHGGPSTWDAVAVVAGDGAGSGALASQADAVPRNEAFLSFVALAAEVSALFGEPELGSWCARQLDSIGDRTIMTGFGTGVFGFGCHFRGVAAGAAGDHAAAEADLRHAIELGERAGADLWVAHSEVELAAVLAAAGDHDDDVATLAAAVRRRPVAALSTRLRRRLDVLLPGSLVRSDPGGDGSGSVSIGV
jgi:DNA-binding SARP family transcriptional activator